MLRAHGAGVPEPAQNTEIRRSYAETGGTRNVKERIQKLISAAGLASRRSAEELMRQGRVRVNGRTAQLGELADPALDTIEVDGAPLPKPGALRYLMLHKPRGYVTTLSDERGRKTAAELVADCGTRVYPVGRLDLQSEGLLLFTNDGALANALMHPRGCVEKTYLVTVSRYRPGAEALLRRRIVLDGVRIAAPQVRLLSQEGSLADLEIVIHEGRNRQIRRMCEAADLGVMRLKRIAEGPLRLGTLARGAWRELSAEEVRALAAAAGLSS